MKSYVIGNSFITFQFINLTKLVSLFLNFCQGFEPGAPNNHLSIPDQNKRSTEPFFFILINVSRNDNFDSIIDCLNTLKYFHSGLDHADYCDYPRRIKPVQKTYRAYHTSYL